jgi:hypothetical protein
MVAGGERAVDDGLGLDRAGRGRPVVVGLAIEDVPRLGDARQASVARLQVAVVAALHRVEDAVAARERAVRLAAVACRDVAVVALLEPDPEDAVAAGREQAARGARVVVVMVPVVALLAGRVDVAVAAQGRATHEDLVVGVGGGDRVVVHLPARLPRPRGAGVPVPLAPPEERVIGEGGAAPVGLDIVGIPGDARGVALERGEVRPERAAAPHAGRDVLPA